MVTRRRAKKARRGKSAVDQTAPTKERQSYGDVERMSETITDEHGMISRPWRGKSSFILLYDRSIINKDQMQAAVAFNTDFQWAQFDELHALNLL
jgi:hypothetical protein